MNDRVRHELDELNGYVDLGMQRECLALVRKILKGRPIDSETLSLHFSPYSLAHAEFEDFFGAADRLDCRRVCRR